MGLNPGTVYWMDIFSHIFVVKFFNVCLKRPFINEKEAEVGPFKKKFNGIGPRAQYHKTYNCLIFKRKFKEQLKLTVIFTYKIQWLSNSANIIFYHFYVHFNIFA